MGINPGRKNPHGKNPYGENQNLLIYLKHPQMCETACKSEPRLVFRQKKSSQGEITAGKIKHCYYWPHSFLHTVYMRSFHILKKKMNFTFSKISIWEIFPIGNIPVGKVRNPSGNLFSAWGFANPRGDFDLCHGIFSRSL